MKHQSPLTKPVGSMGLLGGFLVGMQAACMRCLLMWICHRAAQLRALYVENSCSGKRRQNGHNARLIVVFHIANGVK